MANQYPESRFEAETENLLSSALSSDCSRRALHYFRESVEPVTSLDELAENVANDRTGGGSGRPERVAIRLHHTVLPKLAALGVVDYDPRSRTIRCWDHPVLEAVDELAGMAEHS